MPATYAYSAHISRSSEGVPQDGYVALRDLPVQSVKGSTAIGCSKFTIRCFATVLHLFACITRSKKSIGYANHLQRLYWTYISAVPGHPPFDDQHRSRARAKRGAKNGRPFFSLKFRSTSPESISFHDFGSTGSKIIGCSPNLQRSKLVKKPEICNLKQLRTALLTNMGGDIALSAPSSLTGIDANP